MTQYRDTVGWLVALLGYGLAGAHQAQRSRKVRDDNQDKSGELRMREHEKETVRARKQIRVVYRILRMPVRSKYHYGTGQCYDLDSALWNWKSTKGSDQALVDQRGA